MSQQSSWRSRRGLRYCPRETDPWGISAVRSSSSLSSPSSAPLAVSSSSFPASSPSSFPFVSPSSLRQSHRSPAACPSPASWPHSPASETNPAWGQSREKAIFPPAALDASDASLSAAESEATLRDEDDAREHSGTRRSARNLQDERRTRREERADPAGMPDERRPPQDSEAKNRQSHFDTALYEAFQDGASFAQMPWRVLDASQPWLLKGRLGAACERTELASEEGRLENRSRSPSWSSSREATGASGLDAGRRDENDSWKLLLLLTDCRFCWAAGFAAADLARLQASPLLRQQLYLPCLALLRLYQSLLLRLQSQLLSRASAGQLSEEETAARAEATLTQLIQREVDARLCPVTAFPDPETPGDSLSARHVEVLTFSPWPSIDIAQACRCLRGDAPLSQNEAFAEQGCETAPPASDWTMPTAVAYFALTRRLLPPRCSTPEEFRASAALRAQFVGSETLQREAHSVRTACKRKVWREGDTFIGTGEGATASAEAQGDSPPRGGAAASRWREKEGIIPATKIVKNRKRERETPETRRRLRFSGNSPGGNQV
ncbi:hypothetical protein NCLIV_012310 [Neospora caninum Liverpool]|uniref:Uncharacterized protein n=1 Tax=Neospora caninum (strain Liverpool) TaxID=572307 RepID=F0VCR8_NEOCL|nr:hypothetical protein NCLIV_012310 [Neospora caninum Liverpool]CBZ51433.1 hypothetical protein NCLIV_012310 [Neospora caninum Liverpool]|eukprot:XP_003881466.1 hypothetical protein NCLIV_012310 [Neospora caninum Liverpool]